jgi:hypothetical protein
MTSSSPDARADGSEPGAGGPRTIYVMAALVVALLLAGVVVGVARGGLNGRGTGAPGPDDAPQEGPAHATIRVEVLNGAGVGGLARMATSQLRDHGFDVVFFGNAGRFDHPRSLVLDRTGEPAAARAVAAALAIDSVATDVDASLLLDVTVILGADWPPAAPDHPGFLDRVRNHLFPDRGS